MEVPPIVKKGNYKYCIVPCCKSTTAKTPDKLFFSVPKDAHARKRWCQVMKRDEIKNKKLASTSSLHCCEDHFSVSLNYFFYFVLLMRSL